MKLKGLWQTTFLIFPFLWLGCVGPQRVVQQPDAAEEPKYTYTQIQSLGFSNYLAAMKYDDITGSLKIEFLYKNKLPAKIFKAERVKATLKLPEEKTRKFYLENIERLEHYYFSFFPSDPNIHHPKFSDTIYIRKDWLKNLSAFTLKIRIPIGDKTYPVEYVYPEKKEGN